MSWQEGLTYGDSKELSIHLVVLVTDHTSLEKRIPKWEWPLYHVHAFQKE